MVRLLEKSLDVSIEYHWTRAGWRISSPGPICKVCIADLCRSIATYCTQKSNWAELNQQGCILSVLIVGWWMLVVHVL